MNQSLWEVLDGGQRRTPERGPLRFGFAMNCCTMMSQVDISDVSFQDGQRPPPACGAADGRCARDQGRPDMAKRAARPITATLKHLAEFAAEEHGLTKKQMEEILTGRSARHLRKGDRSESSDLASFRSDSGRRARSVIQ